MKIRLVSGLFCSIALLCASQTVWALRAPRIESAAVTPPNHLMVEFGHQFQQPTSGLKENRQQLTLTQGVAGNQQVDLVVPWRVQQTGGNHAGFGDVVILHKVGALTASHNGRTLVGGFTTVRLPTSPESRVGKDNYQFTNNLLLTQATEHSTFTLNAGSVIQTHGDEMMRYGAGFQYVWERFGAFSEILGYTDFQKNGKNEVVSGLGGIELLLGKRFTLDLGGEVGITKDANDWGAFAGGTVTF
ncbi:MAG: hypothetical protein HYV02_02125 [Deltaproteobacteria bacterium]|nr:hypothetical protein [Deltaproteobacteria bacterium]